MTAATNTRPAAPGWLVVLAFATVYLVWGSTYFFIRRAIEDIPALLMAAIRFSVAGLILLTWCYFRGERIWVPENIKHAAVSGMLLLFIGNGSVVWVEQYLASSLVAVLVSAAPIWFVLLDKPMWKVNFSSRETIIGLLVGFVGVILLFSERISHVRETSAGPYQLIGLIVLIFSCIGWSGGSIYSKYKSKGSVTVNSAWQMLVAGAGLFICSALTGEINHFSFAQVSSRSWFALWYLIIMGSLAAYSAYVWLLQVRPATQVSTYAYVNPVVAVMLGVFFAQETMSFVQIIGLVIILTSVLLINLGKYRKQGLSSTSASNKLVTSK